MMGKRTTLLRLAILLFAACVFYSTPTSAKAKKKVIIKEFEVNNYGKYFKVKLTNKTKRTIKVLRQAQFTAETYQYVGDDLGDDNGFEYYPQTRTLKYRPIKTVKIKPGKTKWIIYQMTSPGMYLFEDDQYTKVSVLYKYKRKYKVVSDWFDFETW